jgi:hypothetical protein
MTYSRDTTAISELTGQPVSTWSEEWQHECEARALMKMSKEEREGFLNRAKGLRGEKAAEHLKTLMERLKVARAERL